MHPCLAQAIDGDASATIALVESLRPRVARMAAYYARRTGEDADDLLQEAWLGLLEALPDLDLAVGAPGQHLVKRARWRLLDAVRRARVRRCASLESAGIEERADDRPTGFERAWMEEFASGLKPYQRAVLGCLLHGLTWREAG
ncbi:MAG TPA: sigma factor, partial [Chthonomonadales bacterium]|nr:sigma factor [Chthonomonadales bacterium]